MKRNLVLVFATALVTSLCWYAASVAVGIQRGIERLWLISAVKAPGRMALDDIQNDFLAGHDELAKAKVTALRQQWMIFNAETNFRGQGIGNIMGTFSQLDHAQQTGSNTNSVSGTPAR